MLLSVWSCWCGDDGVHVVDDLDNGSDDDEDDDGENDDNNDFE